MTSSSVPELIAGGGLGALGVGGWLVMGWRAARHRQAERRATHHARDVERAATEASEEDAMFGPDAVRAAVADIARCLAGGGAAQAERDDAELLGVWSRQHALGAARAVRLPAHVDLLQVVNRGRAEGRVTVRVRMKLHNPHRPALVDTNLFKVDERWTLGRGPRGWRLVEFDMHPLAQELLSAPVIVGPSDDSERLFEASVNELAASDTAGGLGPDELIDPDDPPARQLADLSLADGRFGRAVIEATLIHLIEAWERATVESTDAIDERASVEVVGQLIHPLEDEPTTRLVLRDARLSDWEPLGIPTTDTGVRLVLRVSLSAVRYLTDQAQERRLGNLDEPRTIEVHWTLTLTEAASTPWLLISTSNAAAGIIGVS